MTTRRSLPARFLRACRQFGGRSKLADSTGMELTGRELLVRTLIVRRLLDRVLERDERFVGLLLPPSVGGAMANAVLPLLNLVTVNLNYTTSSDAINHCISQCGIRTVIASRRVLERFKVNLQCRIVCLEDLRDRVTLADKAVAFIQSALPPGLLERMLGISNVAGDDLLTVMFTSGSTGEPKGVMLSHDNVATQIDAMRQAVDLRDADVALGVLPFFHAYGYTATLWTVLTLPLKGVYRATILMSIPTFQRNYLRRVQGDDFRSLEVVFASSEKLVHRDPGTGKSLFEDRGRDSPACRHRGTAAPGPRRRRGTHRRGGHGRAGCAAGRASPRAAPSVREDTGADLPRAGECPVAEPVDSCSRHVFRSRRDPGARQRQAGSVQAQRTRGQLDGQPRSAEPWVLAAA